MSASIAGIGTAQARDWICTGVDSWDNSSCWAPNGLPTTGETVTLTPSGSNILVNYSNTVNPADVIGELRLDATGTGSGVTLQQSLNHNLSANILFIGRDGTGNFLQSNGTNTFGDAFLAGRAGSSGNYELSGSGSVTFDGLGVGNGGVGSFVQTGGTNTVNYGLTVGAETGSDGTYTLSGGTLTVGNAVARDGLEEIGRWGTGSFTQEAGTVHTVNGALVIGRKAGPLGSPATGTYTMNGGVLTADNIAVGVIPPVLTNMPNDYPFVHEASNGHFIQNAGSVTVSGNMVVSESGGAIGLYELAGGTLSVSNLINNDDVEYSGGDFSGNIENHDRLSFSGGGTRDVHGSIDNVGETYFSQYNEELAPPVLVFEETKNGVIELADGTVVAIDQNLTLGDLGTLDIELGSSFFGFDEFTPWISAGGSASIDGILDLTDISGWSPVDGNSWTILEAATLYGLFDTVLFPVLPNWNWELVYGADKILLTGQVSAVPVPAAVWLFGSGLIGLFGVARKRR